ncbi:helicase-primase subunit [Macacine alphaherpesvirus 1]|uniref:Component of DNA helicase-primase complex n=2 Tax=Cercopithecine herpesvirus 1 TaxID=10325 RepID=Q806C1_CHV1|nr:helicase-primase subunit [Macacine alphaherpesvirus 1]AAP41426.1 component of helicase-primase complex [Macacine alphaherpesvirus 1]ARS01869.1 helicase-primase subunit [Macacine alphaherpesvirus 1]ARS02827.1 helicase-primase subunit [Macacine alphaherpesvirus 1]BAC58047.1 component of DNA helicase-primase complex [Macacine alphaherpesvirus 1]
MGDAGLVWAEESICAITLYTAWLPPRTRDRLHVLLYLFCRDARGDGAARFAEVSIASTELQAFYGPAEISAAGAVAAARAAASPAAAPLETLNDPVLWRALYACALVALEREVGRAALFAPARVAWDPRTGLVARIEGLPDGRSPAPRAAALDVNAQIATDPLALAAHVAARPDARLAWARLAAIQDTPQCASAASLTVRIDTGAARFAREYTTLTFPPVRREGAVADVFEVREAVLRPRGHAQAVTARVLVPRGYEYFAVGAEGFSAPALIAMFRQWYLTVHAGPGALPPIFAFLGPEFEPRGGAVDHFSVLGFPGWATLKVSGGAAAAPPAALAAHAELAGAWPAAGARALGPARAWAAVSAAAAERLPPALRRPAAAGLRLLDPPAVIGPVCLARFRFPGLQPRLLAALYELGLRGDPRAADPRDPLGRGARRWRDLAGGEGAAEQAPWPREVLALATDEVRREYPAVARTLDGIVSAVGVGLEKAAGAVDMAVCGDGGGRVWGVLNVDPRDAAGAGAAAAAAERARAALAASASEALAGWGLRLDAPPPLVLEGTYTHAVLWSQTGAWFWNSDTDEDRLEGFPLRGPAYAAAAAVARRALRAVVAAGSEGGAGAEEALRIAHDACDRLVMEAFERRLDAEYWGVAETPSDRGDPLPTAAFRGGALLDAERYERRVVRVCGGPDGGSVSVPIDLYPRPLVLPPIDCAHHLREVLAEMEAVFRGALTGLWGEGCGFAYPFEERSLFMFDPNGAAGVNNK